MKNKMKYFREKNKLSQSEMAFKCGVTSRYISFLESSKRMPSLRMAKKISKVLHKNIEDIFLL